MNRSWLKSKRRRLAARIETSGLFDPHFYVAQHPEAVGGGQAPIDHLIDVGLVGGHKPSADFDPAYYLEMYPDVAAEGQSALRHYVETGRAEGRRLPNERTRLAARIEASGLFDPHFYVAQHPEAVGGGQAPIDHLIDVGLVGGHKPSADFDPAYYLEMYPDVAAEGQSALRHYVETGRAEGRRLPNERTRLAARIEASGLFDPHFYVAQHPEAVGGGQAPIDHLIDVGLVGGHKPSADFDPAYYLEMYPDVAAEGQSALRHYVETGRAEGRRLPNERTRLAARIEASGLFDPHFYVAQHPEAVGGGQAPIDHLIDVGLVGGHKPSADFDPAYYLEMYPDVAAEGQSALRHYVETGRAEGRRLPNERTRLAARIEASGLFDPHFYVALYPEVGLSGANPLDHFMCIGATEGRRPSLEFNGRVYLELNPDVAEAKVEPLQHYVERGMLEGRALPTVSFGRAELAINRKRIAESIFFDASFYLASNAVARHQKVDPVLHYLVEGWATYQDPSPRFSTVAYIAQNPNVLYRNEVPLLHYLCEGAGSPPPLNVAEVDRAKSPAGPWLPDHAVTLARMAAGSYFARNGFNLEMSGFTTFVPEAIAELAKCQPSLTIEPEQPDVSIVIPVYGQTPFVLGCLHSLSLHRSRFSVEIIIADDASPLEHRAQSLETIGWVRYHRSPKTLGLLDNCNTVAKLARGRFLVLLKSDAWVVDGWLDEMIGSFELFPKAGFVGSKLVNGDGTLQEGGGLYWSDGTAWSYGSGGAAADPRYNFARQVDWVSGASITVPMELWNALDGFDVAYRGGYREDVDLAFRIRSRGYEVWYQPLSCALRFARKTYCRDETSGAKAYQVSKMRHLKERWKDQLPGQRRGGEEPDREANRSVKKTMLVIDAQVHTPDRDAGSAIGWMMTKAFRDLGFHQTYAPLHAFQPYGRYTADYQRVGVQVLYAPFCNNLDDILRTGSDYDYVLVYRYNVAMDIIDTIRLVMPTTRIIFAPVDLHYVRMERQALVDNDRAMLFKASRAKTDELRVISKVDCNIPHSFFEKELILNEIPMLTDNIVVLPWISDTVESSERFDERRDVMFVGGFPHTPNVDAVSFFVTEVWPLLATRLPQAARFLAVGDAPPESIKALASERVVVTGHVPAVEPYFAQSRVFVAPLRYGAGIKGKVIHSLANGVPTVATRIAIEGTGLVDGLHCLVADTPDAIAGAVHRLYSEPETWARLREAGLLFIKQNYSWSTAMSLCERALDVADATWMRREAEARSAFLSKDS